MSKTKTEDGNRQDMSVHDKEHPSLAATEEAQDVASLNRIVVGMPAYTDPHNPMTLSGSVNLPLDQHPVTHSEDYGEDVTPGQHVFEEWGTPRWQSGASDPHGRGHVTSSNCPRIVTSGRRPTGRRLPSTTSLPRPATSTRSRTRRGSREHRRRPRGARQGASRDVA
jgi:hypothetical protein